jgi:hypothetical protein
VVVAAQQVAVQVSEALMQGDEDTALRALIEFVDLYRASSDGSRLAGMKDEPATTGRREWDALIAGVVEWLSGQYGLPAPAWVSAPGRFLDAWWFLPPKASLRALIFTETPAAIANHGVFVSRTLFESV